MKLNLDKNNPKNTDNDNPCIECIADCCREVAVPLNTPRTKKDWDEIRWLCAHKNVQVFKDLEGDWLVEFITPCEKLDYANMCKIYSTRPHICSEHSHTNCIKTDPNGYYKILFKTIEDVDNYIKEREMKLKKRRLKKSK